MPDLRKFGNFKCCQCKDPFDSCCCDPANCNRENCKEDIWWVDTPSGKKMALNKDATCHFDTCGKPEYQQEQEPTPETPQEREPFVDEESIEQKWEQNRQDEGPW